MKGSTLSNKFYLVPYIFLLTIVPQIFVVTVVVSTLGLAYLATTYSGGVLSLMWFCGIFGFLAMLLGFVCASVFVVSYGNTPLVIPSNFQDYTPDTKKITYTLGRKDTFTKQRPIYVREETARVHTLFYCELYNGSKDIEQIEGRIYYRDRSGRLLHEDDVIINPLDPYLDNGETWEIALSIMSSPDDAVAQEIWELSIDDIEITMDISLIIYKNDKMLYYPDKDLTIIKQIDN